VTAATITVAALITYWRIYQIPAISDDYLVIWLSAGYGEPGGWSRLALDPLYRCRATFMVLTHWLHRWFDMDRAAYATASLVFHVLNCLAIWALGRWRRIGWRISTAAAFTFAIHHGHQEAVLWYSALPDAMACLFVLLTIHAALVPSRGGYLLTVLAFLLALASKESAVCAVPLLAMVYWLERRSLWLTTPFGIIAALYFVAGFAGRSQHLHYNDGTFALGLHFIPVIIRTTVRMLWPWGFAALLALALLRRLNGSIAAAFYWIAATLGPYAFLTYMPFAPSRHTYIASIGLAFVLASAWIGLSRRLARPALAGLALAFVTAEWGYLWTRKHQQYLDRAEPTEVLLRKAWGVEGEIVIRCFPFGTDPPDTLLKLYFGSKLRPRYEPNPIPTQGCDLERDIQVENSTPVLR
jgi:hypothetical protein